MSNFIFLVSTMMNISRSENMILYATPPCYIVYKISRCSLFLNYYVRSSRKMFARVHAFTRTVHQNHTQPILSAYLHGVICKSSVSYWIRGWRTSRGNDDRRWAVRPVEVFKGDRGIPNFLTKSRPARNKHLYRCLATTPAEESRRAGGKRRLRTTTTWSSLRRHRVRCVVLLLLLLLLLLSLAIAAGGEWGARRRDLERFGKTSWSVRGSVGD